VGSFDEVSPIQYSEYERMGYIKRENMNNLQLFDAHTPGTLQGEGVAFFILSALPEPQSWCRLKDIRMIYKPADYADLANALADFLKRNHLHPGNIDVFINGVSGDAVRDRWNMAIQRDYLGHAVEVRFKHLTGEYATASSFALWLGAMILKHQQIPDIIQAKPATGFHRAKTVLVCNHFLARNYSFMLLEKRIDNVIQQA
jgi:3-oxoacyl-[acyl-carrier-protein] synthase II